MAGMKKGVPYFSSSVPQYDVGPRVGNVSGTKLRESADIFSVENYKRKRPDVAVTNPPVSKAERDRAERDRAERERAEFGAEMDYKISAYSFDNRLHFMRPQIGGTEGANWNKVFPDKGFHLGSPEARKKAEPTKKTKKAEQTKTKKAEPPKTTKKSVSAKKKNTTTYTSKSTGARVTGNWTSKGSGERIRRPNLLDYIRGRV